VRGLPLVVVGGGLHRHSRLVFYYLAVTLPERGVRDAVHGPARRLLIGLCLGTSTHVVHVLLADIVQVVGMRRLHVLLVVVVLR